MCDNAEDIGNVEQVQTRMEPTIMSFVFLSD